MAQATLGDRINIAGSTIGAFERGIRTPSREYSVTLDEFLSTGGALTLLWDEISELRDIPEDWRTFEKAERQAIAIRQFHATLFPGLLQTQDYAHAVLKNTGVWTRDQVERLSAARASRLQGLGDIAYTFVVDEIVLRRAHGSWDILRAQLDHVRGLLDDYGVRLLVIPNDTLFHPNLAGSFRLLSMRDGRLIGQEEYVSGTNVVTGPKVEQLVTMFGHLQGEAMSLQDSTQLLEKIRREL